MCTVGTIKYLSELIAEIHPATDEIYLPHIETLNGVLIEQMHYQGYYFISCKGANFCSFVKLPEQEIVNLVFVSDDWMGQFTFNSLFYESYDRLHRRVTT